MPFFMHNLFRRSSQAVDLNCPACGESRQIKMVGWAGPVIQRYECRGVLTDVSTGRKRLCGQPFRYMTTSMPTNISPEDLRSNPSAHQAMMAGR